MGQSTDSRAELGHLEGLRLGTIRALFRTVDAEVRLDVRWRGGATDRLLDERHAAGCELVARALVEAGWEIVPEATYSRYGERGSIDVLGVNRAAGVAAVFEVKGEFVSWEGTQRSLDAKARLAPHVCFERLGWRPRVVARILVVDDTTANRSRLKRIASLVQAALPARNLEIRRWLQAPVGDLAGVWFVRVTRGMSGKCRRAGTERVRRRREQAG